MSEERIIKAMEDAAEKIAPIARNHDLYLDDLEWGNDCFSIKLFHDYFRKLGGFNRPVPQLEKEMRFFYDPCDDDGRTFDEQVADAVNMFLDNNF